MKSMKSLAFLPLAFSLLLPSSVLALPMRTVFAEQAQGVSGSGVNLEVPPGYGLTINFIETGETVKQAWIGDPSRFVFSSNGNLCPQGLQDSNCTNTGATVIFLRQIQPVDFPGLVSSSDGGTQLTLITEGTEGQKQYSFGLSAISRGKPKYTTLIIKPDSQKPDLAPLIPSRQPPVVRPSVLDQLPTTTSSIQQQTALAQNPSPNTDTTEQLLTVRTPPPSFARVVTRVPSNPIPQTNWIPESPKQPVRASTPKQSPTSTELSTSSDQQRVATPNRPSSSRKVSQYTRAAAIRSPLATKPQQTTAKPKVHRVSASRVTRERTTVAINSSEVRASKDPQQSTDDANAIAFGLRTANENGQIKTRSTMWRKAQSAIRLLRRGKTRVEAAQIANIPQNTLEQLIKWGQERP